MTSSPTCPHLGLASDPTLTRSNPSASHRCYAQTPPGEPGTDHQLRYCLAPDHTECRFYVAPSPNSAPTEPVGEAEDSEFMDWSVWYLLFAAIVAIVIIAVVIIYGRMVFLTDDAASLPPTATGDTASITDTPVPAPTTDETPALAEAPMPTRDVTSTSEPGGQVLGLKPAAGEAGWWASDDTRGNYLGDSFLYAGYFEDQVFISAFRLDLERVPRGAPMREAILQMTGLNDDRFNADSGGAWTVSLLQPDTLEDFRSADFQTLLNAPAAITLVPALAAADLESGRANAWRLDPSALAWLEAQLLEGISEVIVRVIGPTGGGETLFAWDSGSGPSTSGVSPELLISLGAPPDIPPPLPTQPVIIATFTPIPENVLTVAADALTVTAVATRIGTPSSAPANIITPTPFPENRATAEAIALDTGLAPLVIYTPTPANAATVAARAAYATAVALTTGTFTPVPEDAITPSIITPTPVPENAATAAVVIGTATAEALVSGTPTPLPYYIFVATPTPLPLLITATPRPENATTATVIAAQATIIAMTTGTYTPVPTQAVTPTPTRTPTALPLLIYRTSTPQSTPTPIPGQVPRFLAGNILFRSDRPSPIEGNSSGIWLLDPQSGSLAYVTQPWVYGVAQAAERVVQRSQGIYILSVEQDNQRVLQVFVFDPEFNTKYQVNQMSRMSYDAAWRPDGNQIAFVSLETGNDEIYLVDRDGANQRQLTKNDWEWDKHPSWSPDGLRIVFESNRETGRRQLWIMNADGSNQRLLLSSDYDDWAPVWIK